jgi:hypothetical protein
MRQELDMDRLQQALTEVIRDTMQPSALSIWLRSKE